MPKQPGLTLRASNYAVLAVFPVSRLPLASIWDAAGSLANPNVDPSMFLDVQSNRRSLKSRKVCRGQEGREVDGSNQAQDFVSRVKTKSEKVTLSHQPGVTWVSSHSLASHQSQVIVSHDLSLALTKYLVSLTLTADWKCEEKEWDHIGPKPDIVMSAFLFGYKLNR